MMTQQQKAWQEYIKERKAARGNSQQKLVCYALAWKRYQSKLTTSHCSYCGRQVTKGEQYCDWACEEEYALQDSFNSYVPVGGM